jgi:hypothetical protein
VAAGPRPGNRPVVGEILSALLSELSEGHIEYEVEFESRHYQVEVELLENTPAYLNVAVAVDDGSLPASIAPLTKNFICRKG